MGATASDSSQRPSCELSVVIPTWNRQALLWRCLEAVSRQSQPAATFEVIVVDDGCTDGTAGMLASADLPFSLRALSLPHQGEWAARNAGVAAAKGRVCLFLSDDVEPSPELLAAHAKAHTRHACITGIGRLTHRARPRSDWYARAIARGRNRQHMLLEHREASWADCCAGNMSVRREAFLDVGGFSAGGLMNESSELAFRLYQRGFRPTYIPGAHATHTDQRRRAQRFLQDAARKGVGCVVLTDRHRAMSRALISWYGEGTRREAALRRLLMAAGVPPTALAFFGPFLAGERRQDIWCDFVSRYAFWRAVRRSVSRPRWRSLTHGVPVLMYHAFDRQASDQRFVVSARSFRLQMRLIALLGYTVTPLDELIRGLHEYELPPRRAVAITMDDGYQDNLTIAAPVLRSLRYPATIFLVAGRLGGRNDWDASGELAGRALLSLPEVLGMRADSVQFGLHTRTHRALPAIPDEDVRTEIADARSDLEGAIGASLKLFSYPYGEYDDRALDAVRVAYLGACTTEPRLVGVTDDPFLLPRIEILGTDSLVRFSRKLLVGGA